MIGRFPFQKLALYPHMKPADIAVWERFIAHNPHFYDSVDYDVPVGKGAETNPNHPPEMQADHTILTQKKIDVVGYQGDAVHLIEVKPIADMRAMGQILTYEHLYRETYPNVPMVLKFIVCGAVERELDTLFTEHNINIEVA